MGQDLGQREFERRMTDHRGIVFKLAGVYAQPEDREDLAQEIYLQLWRSYPSYDPERRFSTWMYRVALNVAISFARRTAVAGRRTVGLAHVAAVPSPDSSRDRDDRIEDVYRYVLSLDELNRALVLLHLEGHSHREIGEVLGMSATNVSTKLDRVRKRMRKELASDPAGRTPPAEDENHGI